MVVVVVVIMVVVGAVKTLRVSMSLLRTVCICSYQLMNVVK